MSSMSAALLVALLVGGGVAAPAERCLSEEGCTAADPVASERAAAMLMTRREDATLDTGAHEGVTEEKAVCASWCANYAPGVKCTAFAAQCGTCSDCGGATTATTTTTTTTAAAAGSCQTWCASMSAAAMCAASLAGQCGGCSACSTTATTTTTTTTTTAGVRVGWMGRGAWVCIEPPAYYEGHKDHGAMSHVSSNTIINIILRAPSPDGAPRLRAGQNRHRPLAAHGAERPC